MLPRSEVRLSRRRVMKGAAAGVALVAAGGTIIDATAQGASPMASPAAGPMTATTETPAIVVHLLTAYQNEDLAGIMALFAPDAVFALEGFQLEVSGTDKIRAQQERMFASYDDIRFTDVRGFGTNDHAAAEMIWSAIIRNEQTGGQPTPKTVTHTMALICKLANGKFTRVAFYWDNYTSLLQSGALKPLPPATPSS